MSKNIEIKVISTIKQLMKTEQLTQMQLASAIHVGQSTISEWLSGKNEPSIESLWKLADYFDVSIDYIVGRKEI